MHVHIAVYKETIHENLKQYSYFIEETKLHSWMFLTGGWYTGSC